MCLVRAVTVGTMAPRSQPGNDPLRADLLARMVALPGNDPGRGQRVLQSVGSIAVIVLLAIVCVYVRDEGVAGNPSPSPSSEAPLKAPLVPQRHSMAPTPV